MSGWAAYGGAMQILAARGGPAKRGVTGPRALAATNASQYSRYGCQNCRTGYRKRCIASKVMKWGGEGLFCDGKGFGERRCRACSSGCVGGGLGGKEVQARLTNQSRGRGQYLATALLMFTFAARNARPMLAFHHLLPRATLMHRIVLLCSCCCCVPRLREEARPHAV